jgi:hypothetical protein
MAETDTVVYVRKDGRTRRFVGPMAEDVAAQREAEGWERFEPPVPYVTPALGQPADIVAGQQAPLKTRADLETELEAREKENRSLKGQVTKLKKRVAALEAEAAGEAPDVDGGDPEPDETPTAEPDADGERDDESRDRSDEAPA